GSSARSRKHHGTHFDSTMRVAQPPPAQEHRQRVQRPAAGGLAALDVLADARYRLAQPPVYTAEGDAEPVRYLASRKVAEIAKLDQLLLARRQRGHRLTDRLAHERR